MPNQSGDTKVCGIIRFTRFYFTFVLLCSYVERGTPHGLVSSVQFTTHCSRFLRDRILHLLLLDEPFSALDSFLRQQIQAQLEDVHRSFDKKVILLTHSRDEVYQLLQKPGIAGQRTYPANRGTKELFADPGNRQGSIITGCKNIVDARKNGENEVEVPAWGAHFTSVQPVRDAFKAIGICAHSFFQKV